MEKRIAPLAVSVETACQLFPVLNPGTLANLRSQKRGPRYYKIGKKICYDVADLRAFVFADPIQTINHQCDE